MGPDNYIRVILDNVTSDSHFGYIVWTTGLSTVQRIALVEALAPLHKPVAFIDDAWNFLLPEQYAKYPHFRIFLPASYLSGKCVARYLLRNGHTKGAFISYNQHQKWARVRLEAITQSFTDAGFIDGVLPIISDGDNGIPDAFVNKVRRELTEKFPAAAFWYIPALQLAGLEWSQHVYTHILGGDLFPRALQDTTITAWICENDFVALAAMHYLKTTQPPHVQNRIAIIGFDDLPAATENDLTSYNFAPSLIMEKAVGFLINPQQEFFKDKMRIEVEGVLIERGSTIQ